MVDPLGKHVLVVTHFPCPERPRMASKALWLTQGVSSRRQARRNKVMTRRAHCREFRAMWSIRKCLLARRATAWEVRSRAVKLIGKH